MEVLKLVFEFLGPVLVAAVTIIPTIINNRKKTDNKIDALAKQLADHIKEDEQNCIRQARTRILRFYDEECEGRKHSQNHWEDIIDDVDTYENYTANNPDFKNNRGAAAMGYIKESYRSHKEADTFLKHN